MGRNKKQRLRGVEALRALQARRSAAVGVSDDREVPSAPEFEIIERFNGKQGEVWLCKQQGVYFTREGPPMDHCSDESHILDYIGPEGRGRVTSAITVSMMSVISSSICQ